MLVELGNTKGERLLPLPIGWQQERGLAAAHRINASPRSQASNDVAALEAAVVTWRHLVQDILSKTPQAFIQVHTHDCAASPGKCVAILFRHVWTRMSNAMLCIQA